MVVGVLAQHSVEGRGDLGATDMLPCLTVLTLQGMGHVSHGFVAAGTKSTLPSDGFSHNLDDVSRSISIVIR